MRMHGTAEWQRWQNGPAGGRPEVVAVVVVVQDTSAPPHGVRFLIQPRCSSSRRHNRSMTPTLIAAPKDHNIPGYHRHSSSHHRRLARAEHRLPDLILIGEHRRRESPRREHEVHLADRAVRYLGEGGVRWGPLGEVPGYPVAAYAHTQA